MKNFLDTPGKRVIVFFLAGVLLILPLGLKMGANLEPYPAIIMPAGASKLTRAGDSYQFMMTGIYGVSPGVGKWERLKSEKILAPLPGQFLEGLVKNEFGLNPDLEMWVRFKGLKAFDFHYNNRFCLGKTEIDFTKNWLSQRLVNQGYDPREIQVRRVRVSVNVRTGEMTEIGTVDEKTYQLF